MLIILAFHLNWLLYWPIYVVQSRCLLGLVDVYIRLFDQKWLGTPGMYRGCLSQRTLTMFVGDVALRYQRHTTISITY